MTEPTPVTGSKAKAWWALLLPQIPAIITLVTQLAGGLPAPYGAVFASLFSFLGVVSGIIVHQTPFLPPDTAIVSAPPAFPGPSAWPQP